MNEKKGEEHFNSKLTEQQVLEIRESYVPYSKTHGGTALAEKYGVGSTTISYIANGKNWKHI